MINLIALKSDLNKMFELNLSWVEMMKIEFKVLDIDIEKSHTTVHVILQRQSWQDDIQWVLIHNYSEDEKTFK